MTDISRKKGGVDMTEPDRHHKYSMNIAVRAQEQDRIEAENHVFVVSCAPLSILLSRLLVRELIKESQNLIVVGGQRIGKKLLDIWGESLNIHLSSRKGSMVPEPDDLTVALVKLQTAAILNPS
jgi:hypothetical protein